MSRPFPLAQPVSAHTPPLPDDERDPLASGVAREVDSDSIRWVFAATVAFWLIVYAAGRSFF